MRRRLILTRNARSLALLLLAVSLPPAAGLIWFGARLLDQERGLVAQRDLERRQAAAPALARALGQVLSDVERTMGDGTAPPGSVRLIATATGASVDPPGAALWLPVAPPLREADDKTFASADAQESRNPTATLEECRTLSRSPDAAVRAAALLRIGKVNRVARRWDAALGAYGRMAQIRDVAVLGAPAELQARRWSAEVLKEAGRSREFGVAIAGLERDFAAGRWPVDQVTWEFVSSQLQALTGRPIEAQPERRFVANVADTLWRERIAGGHPAARQVEDRGGSAVTVLTKVGPHHTVAWIVEAGTVANWLQTAITTTPRTGARVTLLSQSSRVVAGPAVLGVAATVMIPASETGLPWTIALAPGDVSDLTAASADRRRLVLIGVGALLLLVAGGTYFAWRVMKRELAVSRLQTEFVAAVSHEFRTPLASLRHVTELLDETDDIPADRRRAFYRVLARNADRLQRLVESLLDFSRMESGRRPYDLRDVDAVTLVTHVVDEFSRDADANVTIVIEADPGPLPVWADGVSLSTALWNLLDNAVKYSPDRRDIVAGVHRRADGVAIAVRDHGLGIPAGEQRDIFNRFVRGAEATTLGIKGTGLGLALVSHIVEAHGGSIELESEVGAGSTFTIVLPAGLAGKEERLSSNADSSIRTSNFELRTSKLI